MEEAKITDKAPVSQQSLITMDDMFIQIGKLHIERINSDKIAEMAVKQLNEYKASMEQKLKDVEVLKTNSEVKVSSIQNRLKGLEESNQLYQKNNKELADKIQVLSGQIKDKDEEIMQLKLALEKLKTKPVKRKRKVVK